MLSKVNKGDEEVRHMFHLKAYRKLESLFSERFDRLYFLNRGFLQIIVYFSL